MLASSLHEMPISSELHDALMGVCIGLSIGSLIMLCRLRCCPAFRGNEQNLKVHGNGFAPRTATKKDPNRCSSDAGHAFTRHDHQKKGSDRVQSVAASAAWPAAEGVDSAAGTDE